MTRTSRTSSLFALIALCAAACTQAHTPLDAPVVGESVSATIDRAGGELALAGVVLRIPEGALPSATTITITATDATPPSWLSASSPVLRFEPEGLSFDAPIELRIPFTGDAESVSVFWSAREGGAFVPRSTRVEGGIAIAESTHFSQAFVGTACEGEGCCGRANGRLDVVFMVDNSNSMTEEQAALYAQIPRLARALASGDVDADGTQDFPALESVRVGVVSSDMGTGGFEIPTCGAGTFGTALGDDGVLLTTPRGDGTACDASYPRFAELGADAPAGALDAFVDHVGCIANIGIGGCGFEQPLEAALKAVTPASAAIRFEGGTSGHADGANAGFVRTDSMLAIVMLTDEDDCSAADSGIFDTSSPEYGGTDLNLRCSTYPEAVHPTSRYVDGLLALRADPADVIFATVAGAPPDVIASAPDLDALLADASMAERIDPAMPTRLAPSCDVPGVGIAFPPRRIVRVARDLEAAGAHAVVASICQDDFTPVVDAILARVAARARGECR
ncbi:MAG: hypothetical protein M3Y87_27255 [Myxococcota bacterium]|nr:hypothetical protein [Myxococcota bacterium]